MKESAIKISIVSLISAMALVTVFIFNMHTSGNAREFIEVKEGIARKVETTRYEFDQISIKEQLTIIQADVKAILGKLP